MQKVNEVILSLTNRCNLKCRMCDIPQKKSKEVSVTHWSNTIDDAAKIGASTIVFSGGEPLLYRDLFPLIERAKQNNLKVCITSNGWNITVLVAKRFAQAGVDVVNISIEGKQKTHDFLRGKGSFQRACGALENLNACDIETTVATMVSRYNFKELIDVVNIAHSFGATTIKLQPFSTIFLQPGKMVKEFYIQSSDLDRARQEIDKVIELCDRYDLSTNPEQYLRRLPVYLQGDKNNSKRHKICPAVSSSCCVNAQGEIYPCWVIKMETMRLADITRERLYGVWNSNRHQQILQTLKERGCPGCMMSCYDDTFGKDELSRKIVQVTAAVKRKGFLNYMKARVKRWRKRVRFFKSVRPDLCWWKRRVSKFFLYRGKDSVVPDSQELITSLEEIGQVKKEFKKKIKKWQ